MENNNELLLYGDFKILHMPDTKIATIHYQGSLIPCGMAEIEE